MKILITGGAGYIGSHICVELLQEGFEIVVADNFSNSHPEALDRVQKITGKYFPVYNCDLTIKSELELVFSEQSINAVIHLAGLKAVGESVTVPLKYYQNNLISTLNLCEVMNTYNVCSLVFSSSATVYGANENAPLTEELPLQATNPYGRTKLMAEEILKDLQASNEKWSISILRYFNPVGAHSSGLIGEDPNGMPNNLVPYISQVAIGKLQEVKIFGNDYHTHDGTGIRDYIHVVDLAQGHVKALQKTLAAHGVHCYNLGTGNGFSVLEVVSQFQEVAKKQIPFSITERRKGDIAVSFADPAKAEIELKWKASKSLKEMLEDTWRWQVNNPQGYKYPVKTIHS
ncbi:UDP-glucose 4-epimerase GalE [Metabacillus indicus]|uniref:UDP-glucose 4-epimerase n=1 Tax=Metabacillus indicus TaxID=246786 RepID=A0A084H4G6_METID|nr:UDP-glucose 4-epimerase GalE [Metabacillus indicus]KEZ50322.1 UDP-galactose-4-epimerase [Metabacillus indicus LMG 22858]KEZ54478.1 UDP-galactose-4-epimerase [Metabacillus indicus]